MSTSVKDVSIGIKMLHEKIRMRMSARMSVKVC